MEGNEIFIKSVDGSIVSKATISETIPKEVAVYDLKSLLNLLTLADDQEVEFGDSSLKITKDGGSFEYFYTDLSLIPEPPKKFPAFEAIYSFDLSLSEVNTVSKAASILSSPFISIVAKKGKAQLVVGDPKTSSSNSYKKNLGDCDVDMDARLAFDNFKVIPDDYTIDVCSTPKVKLIHVKSKTKKLEYVFALDAQSTL
jgi:hypothetical protein